MKKIFNIILKILSTFTSDDNSLISINNSKNINSHNTYNIDNSININQKYTQSSNKNLTYDNEPFTQFIIGVIILLIALLNYKKYYYNYSYPIFLGISIFFLFISFTYSILNKVDPLRFKIKIICLNIIYTVVLIFCSKEPPYITDYFNRIVDIKSTFQYLHELNDYGIIIIIISQTFILVAAPIYLLYIFYKIFYKRVSKYELYNNYCHIILVTSFIFVLDEFLPIFIPILIKFISNLVQP